jgi:diacylglycerol O-acyltransferase / trehalose O-mycolyltransferase
MMVWPVQRAARLVLCFLITLVATSACGSDVQTESGSGIEPDGRAQVVAMTELSPRMRDVTIASPALGRDARVRLLLPANHAQHIGPWPVLYLLHGCCDTYESWTRSTDIEELTETSDLLVVMPEGGRVGFYSDWSDGPGWETFHLTELREILEREYGAGEAWAIAGGSMGGLGALAYTARNPELFRAVASFSGVVDTRSSSMVLALLREEGEQSGALWGDPQEDADVWAEHNPYDLAPELRGRPLFLSVGTGEPGPLDEPRTSFDDLEASLASQNMAFAARLSELEIPAQINFYGPGTHSWPYWQRELHNAWPMLQQALGLA